MRRTLPLLAFAFAAAATCALAAGRDWAIYGGTADGNRHSSLTQMRKLKTPPLPQIDNCYTLKEWPVADVVKK